MKPSLRPTMKNGWFAGSRGEYQGGKGHFLPLVARSVRPHRLRSEVKESRFQEEGLPKD